MPVLTPLFELDTEDYPAALSWSGDGRWLALGTTAGEIWLIDVAQQRCAQRWTAHTSGLHQLSWHPTRLSLASSGQDGCARLWQVEANGKASCTAELSFTGVQGANGWVEQLQWRPDGSQLAVAAGRALHVYNQQGALQRQWLFEQSTIAALAWRPKGAQLAVAGYGGVSLYTPLDENAAPRKLAWKGSMLSLAWSPDARVIAAGCQDSSVHFWYIQTYQDSMMSGFAGKPKALAWSRNSRWLAVAADQDIIVWPFDGKGPEDRSPTVMSFHTDFLSAAAFAPKGDWLLAGCRGGVLSLWPRVGAERPVITFNLPSSIEFASWSPGKSPMVAAVAACGRLVIASVA